MSRDLKLFVKASYSKSNPPKVAGECYLCQRVRMIFFLKKLTTGDNEEFVDQRSKQTHEQFKKLDATMLPVLVDNGFEYDDAEEIEAHIEKHFPEPRLISDNQQANKLALERSPMSDFAKWIKSKDSSESKKSVVKVAKFLRDIDDVLKQSDGPFLDGNTLKHPDCILLPKLYHMQVIAAFVFKDNGNIFDERKCRYLCKYMKAAQKEPAFATTRPPADEIQEKWSNYRNKQGSVEELISVIPGSP